MDDDLKITGKNTKARGKLRIFSFTTAFCLWRAYSRSSVTIFSIKRLLHENFALCNQISPIGRSFVYVYFAERF